MKAVITLTGKTPFWILGDINLNYQNTEHVFANWENVDTHIKEQVEKGVKFGYIELIGIPYRETVSNPIHIPDTLTAETLPENLRVSEILPMIKNCQDIAVLKDALQNERSTRQRVKVLEALDQQIVNLSVATGL